VGKLLIINDKNCIDNALVIVARASFTLLNDEALSIQRIDIIVLTYYCWNMNNKTECVAWHAKYT
jgi:hypothetical protein